MSKIYLSIGSNKGNRYSQIKEALKLIREDLGEITSISKIYEREYSNDYTKYFTKYKM